MTKPLLPLEFEEKEVSKATPETFFKIELFKDKNDSNDLTELIRENMKEFDLKEKTLVATYRRLKDIALAYSEEGNEISFVREQRLLKPIACIGIGSFRGLPLSEKIGEIRDLVVQKNFRNRGLGRRLLSHAIKRSHELGYKRLYLETSRGMLLAQKLFLQSGFEPVEELPKKGDPSDEFPCYYLLKDIQGSDL